MQLGTRWSVGTPPPSTLPDAVLTAVRGVEEELRAENVDATAWRWTLTYLERSPVVELDDGTVIRYSPGEDRASVIPPDSA